MEFTEVEQALLGLLRLSNVRKAMRAVILLLLKTEDQKIELCEYLLEHEEATEMEIYEHATLIAGRYQAQELES